MALGNLEQALGVNPFGEQIEVDKMPEAVQDIKLEISEKINSMLEEYKKAYSHFFRPIFMPSLKLDVLLPSEIDMFLQSIIKITMGFDLNFVAGKMISQLINYSYNAGNNNFIITTGDYAIEYLFSEVEGTKKNPVKASIVGNVGDSFGYQSEHCIFDVKGNASQRFGDESKKCKYIIQGNAESNVGFSSRCCTYDITGNAGQDLGRYSQRSSYNITGNAGVGLGDRSDGCTYTIDGKIEALIGSEIKSSVFKILNEENYNLLIKELPKGNTVQLVDSAGRIIRETKKSWLWFN